VTFDAVWRNSGGETRPSCPPKPQFLGLAPRALPTRSIRNRDGSPSLCSKHSRRSQSACRTRLGWFAPPAIAVTMATIDRASPSRRKRTGSPRSAPITAIPRQPRASVRRPQVGVNASPTPSRTPTHDSRSPWIATPWMYRCRDSATRSRGPCGIQSERGADVRDRVVVHEARPQKAALAEVVHQGGEDSGCCGLRGWPARRTMHGHADQQAGDDRREHDQGDIRRSTPNADAAIRLTGTPPAAASGAAAASPTRRSRLPYDRHRRGWERVRPPNVKLARYGEGKGGHGGLLGEWFVLVEPGSARAHRGA